MEIDQIIGEMREAEQISHIGLAVTAVMAGILYLAVYCYFW